VQSGRIFPLSKESPHFGKNITFQAELANNKALSQRLIYFEVPAWALCLFRASNHPGYHSHASVFLLFVLLLVYTIDMYAPASSSALFIKASDLISMMDLGN